MERRDAHRLLSLPLDKLLAKACKIRKRSAGKSIELCGVVNAKSGSCSEDCKFCAQSARYRTNIEEYPLKTRKELVEAARVSRANKAHKFGIVTSGRSPDAGELDIIAEAIKEIREKVGISPCASLGALNEASLTKLKKAGLTRYHHNIETSERYYPFIVSTHDYAERVNTVRLVKSLGMEACSGGIIGMGETWQDRVDMALLLKKLKVDSVPLNFLVPIKGTPLADLEQISPVDAVKTVALFRVILEEAVIKVVAGRETVLRDYQGMIFMAGANGIMVGGYLTIKGRPVEEDLALVGEWERVWKEE